MTTGTTQRDPQNPLPLLIQCCDSLQRYASWTPRQSVSKFCNITKGGCNKFREECELARNGTGEGVSREVVQIQHACWHLEGSGWCSPKNRNPWGDSGNVGGNCGFENTELCRTHGGPCSCYGCITPQDVSNTNAPKDLSDSFGYSGEVTWADLVSRESTKEDRERIQEAARQELCPYKQRELYRENTSFAQCYLTRKQFRQLQTEFLQLYTGLYAFYDPFSEFGAASLIYCLQDPSGTIQFPFYVTSCPPSEKSSNGKSDCWKHDLDMKYKQSVARIMRQAEAIQREQEADFYTILNDPSTERLTAFEKRLGVLYAPDAELSAFILGCVMRMAEDTLGELSSADDPWNHQLQLAIPDYIRGLLATITKSFPEKADIIPSEITLLELFEKLGLINVDGITGTERLALLVEWLAEVVHKPEIYDPLFAHGWINIEVGAKTAILARLKGLADQLKSQPNASLTTTGILPVLEILLSNRDLDAEAFGKVSRVGYENLFAHLAWRAHSPAAKGWIVVPLHAHPFSEDGDIQFRYIAFFLGTFKDTDDQGKAFTPEELRARISAIRLVANFAARDYEYLFLAEVLQGHIDEILSTPGPRFAHDINPWIENLLDPALEVLGNHKDLADSLQSRTHNPGNEFLSQTSEVMSKASTRIDLLKRQLQRLDSVVTAATQQRKLQTTPLTSREWQKIKANILSETRIGPADKIDFILDIADESFCGDIPIIEVILLRLVANSLQHRGEHPFGELTVSVLQSADRLDLVVTDRGPGYDLVLNRGKLRPRLRKKRGRGWALIQGEQLAKLHKGRFDYENVKNNEEVLGAKTTVTLKTTRPKQ